MATNRAHDTPSGLGVIHELDSGRCPSEPSGLGNIFPLTLNYPGPLLPSEGRAEVTTDNKDVMETRV